jgi:putative membrane protein insertion efficiency factor
MAERPIDRPVANVMQAAIGTPALLARGLIRLYRYSLSGLFGRTCRHLPTCSEYAETAIARFGLWRGAWMGVARFWRCRPLGTSGFDPVPESLPGSVRWYRPWRYGRWGSTLSN